MANAVTEHETGFKLGGVLGYELGPSLRIEGELFFRQGQRRQADLQRNYRTSAGTGAGVSLFRVKTSIPVSGSADQLGAHGETFWYDF